MTYKNMMKVIESSDYQKELLKKLKQNNLNLNDLNNLINNCEINCDYDEVLVDLISPWLKSLNISLNNIITMFNMNDNIKVLETTSLNELNELLIQEFKTLDKKQYDLKFLKELKKNILKNKTFDIKTKDVTSFYWFNDIPFGLEFLDTKEIYNLVSPKNDAIEFLEKIKENNLLENFRIVTATPNQNVLSKSEHINKYFGDYVKPNQVITTNDKTKFSGLSILIDDAIHNVEKAVTKNPFVYAFVLNYKHNENLRTGKRIIRINSLNEVFNHLPMVILNEYERFQRKDLHNELLFKDKDYTTNQKINNEIGLSL